MIFQERPLLPQSLLQKLFRQQPEENAVIEINNLLASTPLEKLTRKDVERIEMKYNLKLRETFPLNVEEFYVVYLNYCLEHEDDFSVLTSTVLAHMQQLLDIEPITTQNLIKKLACHIYRGQFRQRINSVTHEERWENALENLSRAMNMDEQMIKKIRADEFDSYFRESIKKIISKNRFSISEEDHLKRLASKLNLTIETDQQTRTKLNRAKKLWQLENKELLSMNVQIPLQKGEICYYHSPRVNWYEYRSDRGVRTPKLLYEGQIYVTSKRIIFESVAKNTSIKFVAIVGVHAYENCLEIRKDKGRSPLLEPSDLEEFSIVVNRILHRTI